METEAINSLGVPFSKNLVKARRQAGKSLSYLETHSVIDRLNAVWKDKWSFEIVEILKGGEYVVVKGRLSSPEGTVKENFGSGRLFQKGDPGDSYKSAASDCLKKCATLFGVGLELYK